jgi:hypothetical protein
MIKSKPQKTLLKTIKTARQWLGLLVVLAGAVLLLLESTKLIPV